MKILSVKKQKTYTVSFTCPECGKVRLHSFGASSDTDTKMELVYCEGCHSHFEIIVRIE